MRKLTYPILLMLMLTISCNRNGQHEHLLSLIDSLIEVNTDSASTLLHQNKQELEHANTDIKTYYHLLLTKLEDKKQQTPASDSLISSVASYYENNDPQGHLAETYYYVGRVNLKLHNGERALVYFQKALMEDSAHLSPQLQSRIYSQVGEVYAHSGLIDEAVVQEQLAYFYCQQAGDTLGMQQANKQIETFKGLNADSIYQETHKHLVQERLQKLNTQIKSQVLNSQNIQLEEENARERRTLWIVGSVAMLAIALVVSLAFNIQHVRRERTLLRKRIEEVQAQLSMPAEPAMSKKPFYDKEIKEMIDAHVRQDKVIKDSEWKVIEGKLLEAFPTFKDKLYSIYRPSNIEYQICLLIKMELSPSNIAKLLALGNSAVSQSRLRMQQKVFEGRGTAKDWDKFILSI